MKKLFLLMILFILLMLRFSLSVRVTEIFQKEVYRMNLSLEDEKIKILKINNKYLLKGHIFLYRFSERSSQYLYACVLG